MARTLMVGLMSMNLACATGCATAANEVAVRASVMPTPPTASPPSVSPATPATAPLPPAITIATGTPVAKSIKAGDVHRYRVALAAGHVMKGVVVQQGVDVEVITYDSTGKQLAVYDNSGGNDPEPFVVEATVAGSYDFAVRPFVLPVSGPSAPPPSEGKYEAKVDLLTPEAYAEVKANERFASVRVRELWRSVRLHRQDAIETFWNELDGKSPIVEPYPGDPNDALVTFVYRAQSPYVGLVGGDGFREKPLVRLADSDLWTLSMRVPADSRFDYAFIVADGPPDHHRPFQKGVAPNARWAGMKLDPHNKLARFNLSRAELPNAPPQPWVEAKADVPKGKVEPLTIASKLLAENRTIGVYTPPGFDKTKKYPLLIAFDGETYGLDAGAMIPLPTILDNLIAAKKIPPIVAALVANQGTRNRDLPGSAPFSAFLATELLPKLRAGFRAGMTAADTIVTGSSLGGLCSMYTVLHHSNVIGNALSQSGSFWFKPGVLDSDMSPSAEGNWLTRNYAKTKKLPIRFYLDAGRFEEDLLTSNRHLRDVLVAKGYPLTYAEFSGGHDYWIWRHTIADGLIALLHGQNRPF
jgi:enterochelin esterase-like enzyme